MTRGRGVACCLTLLAAPLSAQSPEVRADLEQFRITLAQTRSTDTLRSLEHRFGESERSAELEALRRIRRGWVRLRMGELGDGWSYGRAADDFGKATELEPAWTVAWHARGVAQQTEGRWQAANRLNLGKRVGLGSIEDAVRSYARAIAADSTNAAAGRALFETALELRDTARFKDLALPALRQVALAGAADTGVLLALARAERFMGDSSAALAAAKSYLDRGGTRGLGLRELAWSAFIAGEAGGDSAYFAGAVVEDSVSVAAYREDLALIANDSVLAAFDRASGAGRGEWLQAFWKDKGRESLRTAEERLREHYRRLTFAERHFSLEVNRRYYATVQTDMYRSGSTRFDDRGIVYLRYGPPNQRAATITFDIMPNETWRYSRADGDLLLHFAANSGGDIRDYRLVPSLGSVEGVEIGDAGKAATWFAFDDRCALYPPFCKALIWGPHGRAKVLSEEHRLVQASTAIAVTSDGFELGFARPLQAAAAAFVVGRTAEGQLVHVVYQVALEAPDTLPAEAVFRLPLRVRANLQDAAGHSGGWIDTTTVVLLQGSDIARGAVDAVGRVTVGMPPGRWYYRIALSSGDSTGLVLPTDSLDVAPFDGSGLALSDLVLSKNGRGARWVPEEGDTAYFNPRRLWLRSDTLALYHEIYGLPAGGAYSAKLVVRKDRRAALTLKWEGLASGGVTRVNRTLSFEAVRPGDYELEVEVRDAGGRRAVTSRRIRISD
ncbi:MAG: GWxTD domain-containing protein [Gemmatimonadota bacterium]